jgi:hypothetical protein
VSGDPARSGLSCCSALGLAIHSVVQIVQRLIGEAILYPLVLTKVLGHGSQEPCMVGVSLGSPFSFVSGSKQIGTQHRPESDVVVADVLGSVEPGEATDASLSLDPFAGRAVLTDKHDLDPFGQFFAPPTRQHLQAERVDQRAEVLIEECTEQCRVGLDLGDDLIGQVRDTELIGVGDPCLEHLHHG